MSDAFIEKARNNFSFVLSESQSAEEFATRLRTLPRHARDQHEWDGSQCDFHPLRVCSCNECEDRVSVKVKTTTQSMFCPVLYILLHMK